MKTKLSTQSYRGARDFYPDDMQIRNYIFDVWKRVCVRYGFEEYDFPILEPLEIFAAKTGEEIVREQLFSFEDKSGRKLAIRPELTPGTVRLIAQKFNELPKPIKWFMVGNNWRYEKPQVGRGREFYQLEANTFGIASVAADFEIFSLIVAIMKEFGAQPDQFELRFSDRKLINALLLDTLGLSEETAVSARRTMDRYNKLSEEDFAEVLTKNGLNDSQIQKIKQFMQSDFEGLSKIINNLEANKGYQDMQSLVRMLTDAGLMQYCKFEPTIIRGFDYSDGLVYEVFDKNPNNRRSLFGGERFDKLIEIFGNFDLPATGFAMGDWTLAEFLQNWNLLPKFESRTQYFVSTWPSEDTKYLKTSLQITAELRKRGKNVFTWMDTDTRLDKQLKYADKKAIPYVIIIGESEIAKDEITVKDLANKTQQTLSVEEFLKQL
jgi:histidyl-tRNA synthetase